MILLLVVSNLLPAQDASLQWNCSFSLAQKACVQKEVKVTYTGGASPNATYLWNFDGAIVISGTGQGPYYVRWETPGEKHVVLSIQWEGQTCTETHAIVVVIQPSLFHMTGGGNVVPGGSGVAVGLSGSEVGVVYKLMKNGQYSGTNKAGTGSAISFGLIAQAGNYTCLAKVDGSDCSREMEGVAVVTGQGAPPAGQLCMVSFDTVSSLNKLIWNKPQTGHIEKFNIYRETHQNNVFTKIAEVPYTTFSTYLDAGSNPLMRSYRYAISIVDTSGIEGEKGAPHKSIHLNINPGIYGFNLIWNHYLGFDFKTYKIYRKLGSGGWILIDSVASNIDSYTDLYTTGGLATYYIGVVRLEPCNPSLKSGETESVASNTATSAPLGTGENSEGGITIYPNPVGERLMVDLSESGKENYTLEIYGPDGRRYKEVKLHSIRSVVDLSDLPGGLYIVRISGDRQLFVRKLIRQ